MESGLPPIPRELIIRPMKFHLTYADAIARITYVLEAVIASKEWSRHSRTLAKGREPFRRFFNVYESEDGGEWLGIMEWAVLEEMRSSGTRLVADGAAQERIVARMAGHPNIELTR